MGPYWWPPGASSGLRGSSWGLLGASWAAPGASWAAPGASWASPGASWAASGRLLGGSWGLLCGSWAAPGRLLGPPGRLLGPPGRPRGPKITKIMKIAKKYCKIQGFELKIMKIYRFGRVSCFQNAAKPSENVIFEAQTMYFTEFFGLQNRVFVAPGAAKQCILRIRGLQNYRFSAFWAGSPATPQNLSGRLRHGNFDAFLAWGGIQEGGN